MADIRIIEHESIREAAFPGGATYRTLIGDEAGDLGARDAAGAESRDPIRIGIQTSPPGYATPLHSHPYLEVITILEGQGVAWTEEGGPEIALRPGMTLLLPADSVHAFRATGDGPLVTYGLHVSPDRLVDIHDDSATDTGHAR